MSRASDTEKAAGRDRGARAAAGGAQPPPSGARGLRRRRRLAPARRAAAAAAGAAATGSALIGALFVGHRDDLDHRRRHALLGGALQPRLDPRHQAPRPLRQRSPADPPQHPRRAALAGLGQRARHAGPRRAAGAEPGRARSPPPARSSSASAPCRQLRAARRPALLLAPSDRARGGSGGRPGGGRRCRSPGGSPPTPRRAWRWSATSPRRATKARGDRAAAAGHDRRHLRGRPRAWRSSASSSPNRR